MEASRTAPYLFRHVPLTSRPVRMPAAWLRLRGVSGSGKSTLISQVPTDLLVDGLGHPTADEEDSGHLDEPTTGLHPADVDRLMVQLQLLVEAGHSVVLVEHEMRVVAASDWIIDMGPGAGEDGGRIVIAGTPQDIAGHAPSATAPFLRAALAEMPVNDGNSDHRAGHPRLAGRR